MASTKKVKLGIAERIYALGMFGAFSKGGLNMDMLSRVLGASEDISIGKEEGQELELKNVPGANGGENIQWNAEKEREKEFDLKVEVVDLLIEKIDEKNKKGEFGLADRPVLSLYEKLKAKSE